MTRGQINLIVPQQFSYTPPEPDERQPRIADLLAVQDMSGIEKGLDWLDETDAGQPYQVLDIGCEYGAGTQRRFGGDGRFQVTGLAAGDDESEYATNHHASPNTTYRVGDFEEFDSLSATSFDIVFAAGLFSKVADPDTILERVWDLVADPGVLLIREFEDSQHLHYPDNEDLNVAIVATGNTPYKSSRQYGRKLYTRMSNHLDPTPERVELDLQTYHTAGKSREERKQYWDVFHANRIQTVLERAERDNASDSTLEMADYLERAMARAKEEFLTDDEFLDAVTVPLGAALKHSNSGTDADQ